MPSQSSVIFKVGDGGTRTLQSNAGTLCLTPVKNEAWILDRFVRCAQTWADQVIVADQQSEDESRDIAGRHASVTLVNNNAPVYDEGARQRLLIDASRQVVQDGKRVLIALDADEMLSANWSQSDEWEKVLSAEPGTVIYFDWVNILPGFEKCWIPSKPIPFGFVDDGSAHGGEVIHSARVPVRAGAPTLVLHEIKVLHYQYLNWQRMQSKQRWYQAWEHVNNSGKRAVTIYRQYNGMHARSLEEIHPFRREWIERYEQEGIDMTSIQSEPVTWWDRQILEMISRHGPKFFGKQDIWDVDWVELAKASGCAERSERFWDPRNGFERRVHRWLRKTQARSAEQRIRWMQKALWFFGW